MTLLRVAAKRRIAAPANVTYAIIADYRDAHTHIVPPQTFKNLRVESGGVGDGTIIRFEMRALGTTQSWRARVAEPAPGRVLTERDEEKGTLTTFTVDPADAGRSCDVTIATEFPIRDGLAGALERRIVTWFLRRVQAEELSLLDAFAHRRAASSTRGPAAA